MVKASFYKYTRYILLIVVYIVSFGAVRKSIAGMIYLQLALFVMPFLQSYLWHDNIGDLVLVYLPYWGISSYALGLKYLKKREVEWLIRLLAWITTILFLIQYFNSETIYFGWHEQYSDHLGSVKISFPSISFVIVYVFLKMGESFRNLSHYDWMEVILFSGIVFMQLSRMTSFALMICLAMWFFRNSRIRAKVLMTLVLTGIYSYIDWQTLTVVNNIISRTQLDLQDLDSYVRIKSLYTYTSYILEDSLRVVIGLGFPANISTNQGAFYSTLQSQGLFVSDIGYLGLLVCNGIFLALGVTVFYVRCLFSTKENTSLRYLSFFILLTSFTAYNIYHYHVIPAVLLLFLAKRTAN